MVSKDFKHAVIIGPIFVASLVLPVLVLAAYQEFSFRWHLPLRYRLFLEGVQYTGVGGWDWWDNCRKIELTPEEAKTFVESYFDEEFRYLDREFAREYVRREEGRIIINNHSIGCHQYGFPNTSINVLAYELILAGKGSVPHGSTGAAYNDGHLFFWSNYY